MNIKFTFPLVLVAGIGLGYWGAQQTGADTNNTSGNASGEPEILYWVAPMDDNFRRDQPGKSPMGMDLVPVYAGEQTAEENSVTISAATTQNLGVKTTEAVIQPWVKDVSAIGEVVWDGNQISKVYARAEGWLESFNLNSVGQRIAANELMFGLYAPQLVTAQEEYLQALRSGNQVQMNNSRRRLLALGLSDTQVRQLRSQRKAQRLVEHRVARDSVVLSLAVAKGSYVTPKTEIATVVNTDQVWVEAFLPETDAANLSVGDAVTVSLAAFPNETVEAKLDYIYPELERTTRTVKIRAVVANPARQLRAGMFARLTIRSTQAEALQLPTDAIIRMRDGDRVVVVRGDGQFTVKPVRLGAESSTSVAIVEGLDAGDRVVTSGQFLLDAEANGQQALERLTAARTAEGTGSIWGFPRRGQIRLFHDEIESLGWPSMNMVFEVARDINLMPFNKEDRVRFRIQENLDGDWVLTSIGAIDNGEDQASTELMPMNSDSIGDGHMNHMQHEAMNHGGMSDD